MITKTGYLATATNIASALASAYTGYDNAKAMTQEEANLVKKYHGIRQDKDLRVGNTLRGLAGGIVGSIPGRFAGTVVGGLVGNRRAGTAIGNVLGGMYGAHLATNSYSKDQADKIRRVMK